jgi:hypothetical protein
MPDRLLPRASCGAGARPGNGADRSWPGDPSRHAIAAATLNAFLGWPSRKMPANPYPRRLCRDGQCFPEPRDFVRLARMVWRRALAAGKPRIPSSGSDLDPTRKPPVWQVRSAKK